MKEKKFNELLSGSQNNGYWDYVNVAIVIVLVLIVYFLI
jgi:hypothetical protein